MSEPTTLQKAVEAAERLKAKLPLAWYEKLGIYFGEELLSAAKQLEAVHTSFNERGASLVKLQGMLEALQAENEVLMLRSVLAMHIADGDESWEKALCDCPMLDSVYSLKLALEAMTKERDERSRSVCRLMAEHTELKEQLQSTRVENARMREALKKCFYYLGSEIGRKSLNQSSNDGTQKLSREIAEILDALSTTTDNSKEGK